MSICLLGVFRLCRVLEIGLDKLGDKLVLSIVFIINKFRIKYYF